jgi:hypothetical protein
LALIVHRFVILLMSLSIDVSCATMSKWLGITGGELEVASNIPKRPAGALTGSQLASKLSLATLFHREEIILSAAIAGNVPNFLRNLRPVNVNGKRRDGRAVQATIWVMPDYFAIGSDTDFLRVPMTPMTAQRIADEFGFVLPTRKLVNSIYRDAGVKLSPSPMKPGNSMTSIRYYSQHNATIEQQLRGRGRNQLVAGHKKDIVNTPMLLARPMQVAIYGWHRSIGNPIQPLSLVHINSYADYSHGLRLVREWMMVDGKKMSIRDVMRDPQLHPLVSDEGPVKNSRVPTKAHPRLMSKASS